MIKPEAGGTLDSLKYQPPKVNATKFVNQLSHSEGIRKIVLDDISQAENLMQQLMGGAEAPVSNETSSSIQEDSSFNNLPPEAAALMQQMLQHQTVEADPNAGSDMIRKRPEFLEKAMQEAASRDRFEIDIDTCSVLDLFVNKSTKSDVISTLKTLSQVNYDNNQQESIFYYNDVGINFYFDENDIVNEIEIDENYRHQTTKGLKINDEIERAIEIYGAPRMKSAKGAIWNRFSVLLHDRQKNIKLIRLKVRD